MLLSVSEFNCVKNEISGNFKTFCFHSSIYGLTDKISKNNKYCDIINLTNAILHIFIDHLPKISLFTNTQKDIYKTRGTKLLFSVIFYSLTAIKRNDQMLQKKANKNKTQQK